MKMRIGTLKRSILGDGGTYVMLKLEDNSN